MLELNTIVDGTTNSVIETTGMVGPNGGEVDVSNPLIPFTAYQCKFPQGH